MAEHGLSEEQIAAIKHAFAIYDRGGEGVILTREIGTLMKSLGYNVPKDELVDIMNEVDFEGKGTIGIQEFMSVMVNRSKEEAFSKKLIDAFRVFDVRGKGVVDTEVARHIFSSMEEEMPDEEIDELLKEAKIDKDGNIKYEAHKAFGLFDVTDNCVIKTWELKSVLSSLGQNIITNEKLRGMIQEADLDGNGIIDFDEFIKKMISTNIILEHLNKMASELSREELEAYKEAFGLFDANGDGVISTWELKSVLRALGQNPTNEELIEMIREADLDGLCEAEAWKGNGIIDFDEFINMMIRRNNSEESDETLREAFTIFDHDNNNFITCADLRYVIKSLGLEISEETIDEMVREADEDGNGKVGVEEFIKIMRSK